MVSVVAASIPAFLAFSGQSLPSADRSRERITVVFHASKLTVNLVSDEDEGPDLENLFHALKGESQQARQRAIVALAQLDPKRLGPIVPLLRLLIYDSDPEQANAAIAVLSNMAPSGTEAIAPLVELLDWEGYERMRAHLAVRGLSSFGKNAVPWLIRALPNYFASDALGRIGPEAADAAPALVRALDSKQFEIQRVYAALALAEIGPTARKVAPRVREIYEQEKKTPKVPSPLIHVTVCLVRLEAKPDPILVAEIRSFARGKDPFHSRRAAFELARLDEKDPDGLPFLIGKLKSNDRMQVAELLGKLGTKGKGAIGQLEDWALDDGKDASDRGHALRALAGIDPAGALLTLAKLSKHKDRYLRRMVIRILEPMEASADKIIPILRGIAKEDEVDWVREAAEDAIKKIERLKKKK